MSTNVQDDEILVRWEDEKKCWHEGVVMCVVNSRGNSVEDIILVDIEWEIKNWHRMMERREHVGRSSTAIIYDRRRSQRAIVPLSKVVLVKPRDAEDA